jgi:hypothetical protein
MPGIFRGGVVGDAPYPSPKFPSHCVRRKFRPSLKGRVEQQPSPFCFTVYQLSATYGRGAGTTAEIWFS